MLHSGTREEMKTKKTPSKSNNKYVVGRSSIKKRSEPILLRKVNNVDKLFTKKDIKNIVDSVVNRNQV